MRFKSSISGDNTSIEDHYHFIEDDVYQMSQSPAIDSTTIRRAGEKLDQLPLNAIPKPKSISDNLDPGLNSRFVGRGQDLKNLAFMLKSDQATTNNSIGLITGTEGVGKTQLAREFVRHYGQYFAGGVYWLNFADPQSIPSQIVACGRVDKESFELENQVRLMMSSWQSPLPKLIVFDKCEEEEPLKRWLPKTGAYRVLITSCRQNWDINQNINILELKVLKRSCSVELLQKLAPFVSDQNAHTIAQELGDFPLALHLAGSYLKKYANEISPMAYIEKLQCKSFQDHEALLKRNIARHPTKNEFSVARTFIISHDRLDLQKETDRIARDLLYRAAWFVPNIPFPKTLLFKTLENKKIDPKKLNRGLSLILDLGLVESVSKDTLMLHHLAAINLQNLSSADTHAQSDVANALLGEAIKINTSGHSIDLIAWQSHLRFITDFVKQKEDKLSAGLCNAIGYHFHSIGDFKSARQYYKKAYKIRKKILGEEHLGTANILNNLGLLMQNMGDVQMARTHFERSLKIRMKLLGEKHIDTATSLNNLGYLLEAIGDLQAAYPYYKKAIEITKKVLGIMHPDTAVGLNDLGDLLEAMGNARVARLYFEKALEIRKKTLGEAHPDTATSLNSIGFLLQTTGNNKAARPYIEKAFEIRKKILNETHPDIAVSLNNMGLLREEMGDIDGAQAYYQKAFEISRKVLGSEHPLTEMSLNNLELLTKVNHAPKEKHLRTKLKRLFKFIK